MVEPAVQLPEDTPVLAVKGEACGLVDGPEEAAPLVGEGLYPLHRRSYPADQPDRVSQGLALTVPRGGVVQPHAVELKVLAHCRTSDHAVGRCRVHGIAVLQDAQETPGYPHAQVQRRRAIDPRAVVVGDDYAVGDLTVQQGHGEVAIAEPLRFPASDREEVPDLFAGDAAMMIEVQRRQCRRDKLS